MKSNLKDLENYAIKNNVPIIMEQGLEFILNQIKQNNILTILEIGTAIGYSAISFAMNGCSVTSIERNVSMYEQAVKNVENFNLNSQIELIFGDALLESENITKKYDLIFIDAAKAQYEKFFNIYKKNLNSNGIIVCDNLNFHNLEISEVSRHTRQLIGKINRFKDFLKNNQEFQTEFFEIGDGMSVSKRNEKINNDL